MDSLEDEANERTRLLRKEDEDWRKALIAKYKQTQGGPPEKAKPPKGRAVALSTTH